MKNNLTDITFLLDRTGSMSSIASDVVGGVNTFIEKQKAAPGEALFTLIQFDSLDPHEVIHNAKPIHGVPEMQQNDFVPRSTTPLLDALGMAIAKTGERLSKVSEQDRPGKVIFVVFTDGYENASKEYKKEKIAEMVKHQTEKYQWDFIFLGAGIDAFAEAGQIGVSMFTTANVNLAKTHDAIEMAAKKVASYRGTGLRSSLNYTDDERSAIQ